MRYLLIGGSGFIGSVIAKNLRNMKIPFSIFDIKRSKIFEDSYCYGDVRSKSDLSNLLRPEDVIINLAAEHADDVSPISKYYDVNVTGARNIVNVASDLGIKKIIFTSSVAVYGFAKPNTNEDGAINPYNHYGKSKIQAEEIFKVWQSEDPHQRVLVIVRPTVVFGEGNRGNVFNMLNLIANKKFFIIGSGHNKKSMAYVENVASFIEYSIRFKPGVHIYNYVDKPDFTMSSFVHFVNKSLKIKKRIKFNIPYLIGLFAGLIFDFFSFVFNKKFSISYIRIKKFCTTTTFSSANKDTGFKAPFSLHQGLKKTLKSEF